MNNKIGTIRDILEQNGTGIIFAYLFGSLAKSEKTYPPKDIDIAIFFEKSSLVSFFDAKIDIYGILSRSLKTSDIDIVVLNTATNLILLDEIIRCRIDSIFRIPRAGNVKLPRKKSLPAKMEAVKEDAKGQETI